MLIVKGKLKYKVDTPLENLKGLNSKNYGINKRSIPLDVLQRGMSREVFISFLN